jgi:hypothetical protein
MQCRKCWDEAGRIASSRQSDQVEEYTRLIDSRKENPCSPEEQAGEYWDTERQVDTRYDAVDLPENTAEHIAEQALAWVEGGTSGPEVDGCDLDDILYTISEGRGFPDDIDSVSVDQCVVCWKIIERLRANRLPKEFAL